MPVLIFASINGSKRQLFREDGTILDRGSVFDHFRLTSMAPDHGLNAVGNFWHLPALKHSAIAWRMDGLPKEQKIFLPGLLKATEALELARVATESCSAVASLMPSPIIFRVENLHEDPLIWEDDNA